MSLKVSLVVSNQYSQIIILIQDDKHSSCSSSTFSCQLHNRYYHCFIVTLTLTTRATRARESNINFTILSHLYIFCDKSQSLDQEHRRYHGFSYLFLFKFHSYIYLMNRDSNVTKVHITNNLKIWQ